MKILYAAVDKTTKTERQFSMQYMTACFAFCAFIATVPCIYLVVCLFVVVVAVYYAPVFTEFCSACLIFRVMSSITFSQSDPVGLFRFWSVCLIKFFIWMHHYACIFVLYWFIILNKWFLNIFYRHTAVWKAKQASSHVHIFNFVSFSLPVLFFCS